MITNLPVPAWVTSDTHLGHANILTYCPWRQNWAHDIREHDEAIIAAWNSVVGPKEWVLHLGDFALGSAAAIAAYRQRLNGHICLVLGNHDRTATSMRSLGFDLVARQGLITTSTGTTLCIHDPAKAPDPLPDGITQILHGHCHGKDPCAWLPAHLHPLVMDCGIDAVGSIGPTSWAALTD